MKSYYLIPLVISSILLSGCNRSNNGLGSSIKLPENATQAEVNGASQIIQGQTTKVQIVNMFGKPTAIKVLPGGKEDWIYDFKGSRAKQLEVIPQTEIAYGVGPLKKEKILQVVFDSKGVVELVALLDSTN